MDRAELLTAKAAELSESLVEWAKSNLSPGEQLLVSLRIQNMPIVAVDTDCEAISNAKRHNMKILDFFITERLKRFTNRRGIPARIQKCIKYSGSYYTNMTLDEFVERVTEAELLLIGNFGLTCLWVIKDVLYAEGLRLKSD